MKILDTTFLIDLLRGDPSTRKVFKNSNDFATTQINMFEVIRGIFRGSAPKVAILKASELFRSIDVLPLTDIGIIRAADIWTTLAKKGKSVEDPDCLTAGIALAHRATTIISRNVKHFERMPGIKTEIY